MSNHIPTYTDYNNGNKFETNKEIIMSLPKYDLNEVKDNERKSYEPGEYFFTVKDALSKTGGKGEYTTLILTTETNAGDCNVYENIFYTPAALFKLKGFIEATGIEEPSENEHFIGAAGKANFVLNEKGYLEVKWYLPKSEVGESPVERTKSAFQANKKVEVSDLPF